MDSEEEELFFSDEASGEEQEEGSDFSVGDAVAAVASEEEESEEDFESDDDFQEKAPKKKAPPKKTPAKKATKKSPVKAAKPKAAAAAASGSATKRGTKRPAEKAAAAPKAKKAATGKGSISEKDAGPVVREYLESTNRPYSTINIFDNLHGAVKKASLQRVLDALAAEGQINEKVCGKSKVYWALQDQYGDITSEVLASLRADVKALEAQVGEAETQKAQAAARVAALEAEPSDEDLAKQLKQEEDEIAGLEQRYASVVAAADGVVVTAATKEGLVADGKKYRKRWSELRGKVMDIVARMSEGMDKSVAQVFALTGMEQDSEYDVNIKDFKF